MKDALKKALIWFACIFAASLIISAFRMGGIALGAIPTVILYVGAFCIAIRLTDKL